MTFLCFRCRGSGRRHVPMMGEIRCDACYGTGRAERNTVECDTCKGSGRETVAMVTIECRACKGAGCVAAPA